MSALMIQGASSSAGKSLLTTALARALHRRGLDVVPFKAQNMSNNARAVAGGEIGTAQYLQALAAGVEPDVCMNPVLVKPEGDDRSQVVILGRADLELSRRPWRERAPQLWPVIERSLRELLGEHELVLIEGAGSPAEINLLDTDLANMRTADLADASVLLVADIDRGGAFAHLYGTWSLVAEAHRARLAGFVLNKFRGDPALLAPAPRRLEELTGVPTVGVVPWLEHGLPDEDGAASPSRTNGGRTVAIIRYPTASNLDEFKPLEQVAVLIWACRRAEIADADLVVLPGSKHVAADLAWLERSGLAGALRERATAGRPILGICGGMQMLGERIKDPAGIDGDARGLGLLAVETMFVRDKQVGEIATRFAQQLPEPWSSLSGGRLSGYQIRYGETTPSGPERPALADGMGFLRGPVMGIAVHGLFEQPELVEALLGAAPRRSLDDTFDELADAVEEHLDMTAVVSAAAGGAGRTGVHATPPIESPQSATPKPGDRPRSLVLVNTGDGKGKSTAAFGVMLRGLARGWSVCVVQFIKSDKWKVGEEKIARELGVSWLKGGDGFTWESPDLDKSEGRAAAAWELAAAAIAGGQHKLVVLDEITYPINWSWIDGEAVVEAIRERPAHVNVVATGRDAPEALIEIADTVTEMVKVRHAYDRGIRARRGIDF